MELGHEQQVALDPGCESVVESEDRRQLIWLMAEFFRTVGYTDVKARLPGFSPPPVLSGTLEDHRPDVTCRQTNSARTPLIAEVVTPDSLRDPGIEHRWSLLGSAAKLYNAELHFVVRKWSPVGSPEARLKLRLAQMELTAHRVWAV